MVPLAELPWEEDPWQVMSDKTGLVSQSEEHNLSSSAQTNHTINLSILHIERLSHLANLKSCLDDKSTSTE
jgi:hypothetical protein